TTKELRHYQQIHEIPGIVYTFQNRNLEFDINTDAGKPVAHKHAAKIDIQHLAYSILRVVVQALIQPLQWIVVGQPRASEITEKGFGAIQTIVGSIGADGIQRFHVTGTHDLHGSDHGR